MAKFVTGKLLLGLILTALIVFIAVFAPVLAPNDPDKMNVEERYEKPSNEFPLGTDEYGRCLMSRLMHGAKYSLGIAIGVVSIVFITSVPIGMIAAYYGGVSDTIFKWLSNMSMSLPPLIMVLSFMGILGNGILLLMVVSVFSYWGWYGKMVRCYAREEMDKSYISYARLGGCSTFQIFFKHVLPNITSKLLVLFALGIGDTILMISGYSFLGIGLSSETPEWGAILSSAKDRIVADPTFVMWPGICVFLTVCSFNLMGEGMRDKLMPSSKAATNE